MITEAKASGERINRPVQVLARCPTQFGNEVVASFDLMLSLKVVT